MPFEALSEENGRSPDDACNFKTYSKGLGMQFEQTVRHSGGFKAVVKRMWMEVTYGILPALLLKSRLVAMPPRQQSQ